MRIAPLAALALTLGTAGPGVHAQPPALVPAALPASAMSAAAGSYRLVADRTGRFNGHAVRYRVTVEDTLVSTAPGRPSADLFTTSYEAQGGNAARPVLFIFNGGPGGSSAPLHLTALGPRLMADTSRAALADPAATRLVDNPASPLDSVDLVFIDPIDTGFSRVVPGASSAPFHTLDGDSQATALTIARWMQAHGRTASPAYVLGESYGSMRAVAVARDLARMSPQIVLGGIVLCGPAITYNQTGRIPNPARLASEIVMMASVAWHWGLIDRTQSWETTVEKARRFAKTDYVTALTKAYALPADERARTIASIHDIAGIPPAYFEGRKLLRITDFNAALLRDRGLVLDGNNGLEAYPPDPPGPPDFTRKYAGMTAAATRAFTDLGVSGLGPYYTVTPYLADVFGQWKFEAADGVTLDVVLSRLMAEHQGLRVLVLQGRYDTLTQMGVTEYTLDQADLPRDRVRIAFYDGGHALAPTAESLGALRGFLAGTGR